MKNNARYHIGRILQLYTAIYIMGFSHLYNTTFFRLFFYFFKLLQNVFPIIKSNVHQNIRTTTQLTKYITEVIQIWGISGLRWSVVHEQHHLSLFLSFYNKRYCFTLRSFASEAFSFLVRRDRIWGWCLLRRNQNISRHFTRTAALWKFLLELWHMETWITIYHF